MGSFLGQAGFRFVGHWFLKTGVSSALFILAGNPGSAFGQDLSEPGVGGRFQLFQFPPETPAELLQAVQIAQKLDRVSEARDWLKQLSERDPSSPEMQALRRESGLSHFVAFARDTRLQPEAADLLRNMQQALPQLSAGELADRVGRLGTPGRTTDDAIHDLLMAGEASLPVLLAVDPASAAGRVAGDLLEQWSVDFRAGLLDLLSTSDSETQVRILDLLGRTARSEPAIRLLRWQFSGEDPLVRAAAGRAIQRLVGNAMPDSADAAVRFLLLQAESALREAGRRQKPLEESAVSVTVDPRLNPSSLQRAEQLIADALAVAPGNEEGLLLQFVSAAAGTAAALSAEPVVAVEKSGKDLIDGLEKSLELEQGAAAVECLKGLFRLSVTRAEASDFAEILAEATESPDARVRILSSVLLTRNGLAIGGVRAGVFRSLLAAKSGGLKPEAVVIAPDDQLALLIRHLLEDMNYEVAAAETGPTGFEAAAAQMNCELVFLSMYPSRWPASVTLANLRADIRTRNTPVVLVGPEAKRVEAEALAAVHPGVEFVSEPIGALTFPSQFRALSVPLPLLNAEDREVLRTAAK
ncbi:MAG: hypothetical protein WCK86_01960 [Planctomycetia bacterium]